MKEFLHHICDNFLSGACENADATKKYFHDAEEEISTRNFKLLKILSFSTTVLIAIFLAAAGFIIDGWQPTLWHIAFLPATAVFGFAVMSADKSSADNAENHSKYSHLLCIGFQILLYIFIIAIDVFRDAASPSSFMPVVTMVLPALFILPVITEYSLITVFVASYIGLTAAFKLPGVAQYDIFNAVVATLCSVVVATVIIRLRINDHTTRMMYRSLSMRDSLSGLMNKNTTHSLIRKAIAEEKSKLRAALIFIDVDNFKRVNDQMGHYFGDTLLKEIANALTELSETGDILGRFGGDEFILFMRCRDRSEVERRCGVVQAAVDDIAINMGVPFVSCSLGVAIAEGEVDFEELLKQADDALYDAKREGKNRFKLRKCVGGGIYIKVGSNSEKLKVEKAKSGKQRRSKLQRQTAYFAFRVKKRSSNNFYCSVQHVGKAEALTSN